jgi:hypothetical protein
MMCLQYEYDLPSGNLLSMEMTKGLRNDQQDSRETTGAITADDLHIRDLGYITPAYLSAITDKKAFFLNRLPAMAGVFTTPENPLEWKSINSKLKRASSDSMELDVLVFEKNKIPCRLTIERVGSNEYNRRLEKAKARAKSEGVGISRLHKIKLQCNTFITNASPSILPVAEIRKTYYLRWQVELIFKTRKSFFRINKIKKVRK